MDYQYENLGDERFQEFCSALISKEFPNIQAYPVGQPDGGRDTIVYNMDSVAKEFIVFQVKYVRNANEEKDIHKWLMEVINKEAKKINDLIPKGATKYYLLTNVRGTAHLDSGSKDKVNKILETSIKVPTICWWRDDLNILFEKDSLFKWAYPELINGKDILNSLLFNQLNENRERRENAINSYLVDQYDKDSEVKFKQIDLKNRLLDLFTDVPIRIKIFNQKNKKLKNVLSTIYKTNFNPNTVEHFNINNEKNVIGAAEFLLNPIVQNNLERVLLEGGPGQGKSTISQYISQIHRIRLLNKQSELDILPLHIKNSPVRLPFKIDLRHIATWLENKNPYQDSLNEEYFKRNWSKSLESFLVGHIFHHSKLDNFTSGDLIAVLKYSPVLIVFDGFDEIANIEMRSEVIDFINRGISRIVSHAQSLQVIVTSRPAAFLDAEGFSKDHYPHFELTNISNDIINEYLEKWIKASDIEFSDAKDLRKLVKEKLELPHLKELAKSPMQLAILISLLRTKGRSLPNKRTALYDSYVDLFFDRESEKNSLILDKRELIINIHQYLAWVLHSEAELYKNSGIMHIDDLKSKVKEYLTFEGHDTEIADQLFNVMKERVCALVSRVQGTFEFEVQPLREYFCAKFLYKTAHHSSAGSIRAGTKPERLHAILRNFYWQNVVRFFAGCADRGELDMIIQELKELQNDDTLKYTDYPRIITSQILSDYVFTQAPLKLKDVVLIIANGINLGNIINQKEISTSNEPIQLPVECGRNEIVDECFKQLKYFPTTDYADELIGIINNNPINALQNWIDFFPEVTPNKITKWLEFAYKLQLVYKLENETLVQIMNNCDLSDKIERLQIIIKGNRSDIIEKDEVLKKLTFDCVLNIDIYIFDRSAKNSSLNFISLIFHPFLLRYLVNGDTDNRPITFLNHFNRYFQPFPHESRSNFEDFEVKDIIDSKILEFKKSIEGLFSLSITDFTKSLEKWDNFVENGRRIFGDRSILIVVAVLAAGIKSKDEVYDGYEKLHDSSLSLSKRVRCARMKSGNIAYWSEQLKNQDEYVFTLIVFLTWGSSRTLCALLTEINEILNALTSKEFKTLTNCIESLSNTNIFTKIQRSEIQQEVSNVNNRNKLVYILSLRFSGYLGQQFVYENIDNDSKINEETLKSKYDFLIRMYLSKPDNISYLNQIKSLYRKIDTSFNETDFRLINLEFGSDIPYDIAKEIMANCNEYPWMINYLAEKSCRKFANNKLVPIGEIANNENWF